MKPAIILSQTRYCVGSYGQRPYLLRVGRRSDSLDVSLLHCSCQFVTCKSFQKAWVSPRAGSCWLPYLSFIGLLAIWPTVQQWSLNWRKGTFFPGTPGDQRSSLKPESLCWVLHLKGGSACATDLQIYNLDRADKEWENDGIVWFTSEVFSWGLERWSDLIKAEHDLKSHFRSHNAVSWAVPTWSSVSRGGVSIHPPIRTTHSISCKKPLCSRGEHGGRIPPFLMCHLWAHL